MEKSQQQKEKHFRNLVVDKFVVECVRTFLCNLQKAISSAGYFKSSVNDAFFPNVHARKNPQSFQSMTSHIGSSPVVVLCTTSSSLSVFLSLYIFRVQFMARFAWMDGIKLRTYLAIDFYLFEFFSRSLD